LLGAHPDTGAILGVVSVAKLDLAEDGYIIEMIAVENSARSQRIGDEAMNEALQWIANHADVRGIRTVTVVADCHRRNKRARALLRRNKFLSAGVEGVREEWFYEFSLR
jgi:GNAT superfamily N-acetyltransferase